jgi:hypothetical protein
MATPPNPVRSVAFQTAILLSAIAVARFARADWVVEPVDLSGAAGWSLNLDVDSAGDPHAAYFTSNGGWKYKIRGASGWTDRFTIPSGDAFALDGNDDPYFITSPSPNFYPQFQILLDNNLLLGQQLFGGSISENVFLDFDAQDRPQVGYVDPAARQLKHAAWNGSQWLTRIVATGNEFQFGSSDFTATLDGQGAMHFAWRNASNVLRYAKPTSTSWTLSSPVSTADARPYDLDVDDAGNVHLAYDVFTGSTATGGLHYGKFNGSSWSVGRVSGLDGSGAARTQVVADETGAAHLFTYDSVFRGPDVLKHVFREDGVWTSETLDSRDSNFSGPETIEAMWANGNFHVLFATGNKEIYYAYQPAALDPADFNRNGRMEGEDLAMWSTHFGSTGGADADADGDSDGSDFLIWQRSLSGGPQPTSPVPEPASALLITAATLLLAKRRRA